MARTRAPARQHRQSRLRTPWAALSRLRRHQRWKVWFARSRAAAWAVVGALSFPLGWANSVVLVWIASVYANVASEMATGEAADDKALTDRLDRIEAIQQAILDRLSRDDIPQKTD